jgi:hypothetical protein
MPEMKPTDVMVKAMTAAGASAESIKEAIASVEGRALASGPRSQQLALLDEPNVKRGTRLSETWQPSARAIEYARHRGLSEQKINVEAEKFKNYWIAKSGANAVKRDWEATWRNWIINVMERRYAPNDRSGPGRSAASRRPATGADAVLAGLGRVAARISEGRMATGRERETPQNPDAAGIPNAGRGPTR